MPPRRRNLKPVPAKPERERAPDLRDAVKATVDAMDWLGPTDQAMKVLAMRQAEEIERAIERAEELAQARQDAAGTDDVSIYRRLAALEAMCDVTKAVGWLGPQLQGVLRDLGGTPAARKAMKNDRPIGGRLAQLRAGAAGEHDS
ncbi:terminase small subunit [Nonomuraea sp. CA-141351]|uniref:terminase small subunit n=1 Tax=Nonomuraea sp. CA-141351 TaxID=3239996 RepID=UPI003D92CF84